MSTELTLFGKPRALPKDSDEHYTPRWIFEALGLHFELDVAAPIGGPPYTPCDRWYDIETDGLESPWHGIVFMNPPYSKMTPWVDKWIAHGNGIALLPFARSKWMDRINAADTSLCILPSDFGFIRPDGAKRTISYLTGIWAIGTESKMALTNSGLGKAR